MGRAGSEAMGTRCSIPCPAVSLLRRPGVCLFGAFILLPHLGGFPLCLRTSLQRKEDILSCPGPCSAGTVARQPVSLCILAHTGALLSGKGCSGLSPLPIVKQLPSWPYRHARGSLSCSAALKRRGVGQGAAGHLPFGAPHRAPEDLGGFKGCVCKNRNPLRGAGGGGTRPGGC